MFAACQEALALDRRAVLTHLQTARPDERVQLASYGSCKRNRCARYFDLGEYQMRCGSGGGKGGHRSVPILGNCKSAVGGERRSGEERLLEAILVYDDKTLK